MNASNWTLVIVAGLFLAANLRITSIEKMADAGATYSKCVGLTYTRGDSALQHCFGFYSRFDVSRQALIDEEDNNNSESEDPRQDENVAGHIVTLEQIYSMPASEGKTLLMKAIEEARATECASPKTIERVGISSDGYVSILCAQPDDNRHEQTDM